MDLVAEYQELSGHHREFIYWLPAIGSPSALRKEAGDKARQQEADRLVAAVPS